MLKIFDIKGPFERMNENKIDCPAFRVSCWIHDNSKIEPVTNKLRPAVIICPGGAYAMVSDREAEPVAKEYFVAGYNVFILRYSVGKDARDFIPLMQLADTMAYIRENANEFKVFNEKIAVCGFSAGGHLAASLGTLFDKKEFLNVYGRNDVIRPDAMILCYPVITSDKYAHVDSIEKVSGATKQSEEYCWFGLDQHVNEKTPPTFLWHTMEDQCVPVENSLRMAGALSTSKIPFELHIFPKGQHGMSVCTEEVGTPNKYNARWMDWSIRWLNKQFI